MGLEGYKELVQVLSMESKLLVTPISSSLQEPDCIYNDKKMIKDYHNLISDNLNYIEENFSENIIHAARAIRGSDRVFLFGKGANLNTMRAFKNYLIKLDIWTNYSNDLDVQKSYIDNVSANDVCFIFSYSGLTEEMQDFYTKIKEKNGKIVLLTSNIYSPMFQTDNINILVLKGEEADRQQRNSLVSFLFIVMEIIHLLSN